MRKFMIFLALMFFIGLQVANAQRTISGTVTSAEDNQGIPGATILVKGTTIGVITDVDGKFTLTVPQDKNVILVSFVGMKTQEITLGTENVYNVILQPEIKQLEGVVVTALGITREKKALGYSVQDVKGDVLQTTGSSNVINQLSGRIAGVQITTATGNMGGSSRVLIRGINSVYGNNQPLYVVDGTVIDNSEFNTLDAQRGAGGYDYGNMAQDINPEDIANVSVLKGANAAALYGSRAANGVILITTKKGQVQKGKAIGIEFNTGLSFEQVAYLPEYQNDYGGGNGGLGSTWEIKPYTDNSGQYKIPFTDEDGNTYQSFDLGLDYGIDESWGPKYDTKAGEYINTLASDLGYTINIDPSNPYYNQNLYYRPYYSFDSWDTEHYGKSILWQAPKHDVKDFFQTGLGWNNNLAFNGGNENAIFRLTLGTYNSSGYMPESTLDKYTVGISAKANLTKTIQAFTDISYISTKTKGRPEVGYGDVNPVERFNQWGQRQLDMWDQKSYINPDGTQRSWNRTSMDDPTPAYSNNPYWDRNMNYQNDKRDRYYGNVGASWQIAPWVKMQGKINLDQYTFRIQERVAIYSASESFYREEVRTNSTLNMELLFMFDKSFGKDWRLTGTLGGNKLDDNYRLLGETTIGGLLIPELYTSSNALDNAAQDFKRWKRINSIFGSASIGWRGMVYLDVTAREDWSSSLPLNDNSYFYPSFSLSWLISELEAVKKIKWISLIKVRGGWAEAGNDTDPYRTQLTYSNFLDINNNNYPYHFPPYGLYTVPLILNNPDLKSELTKSWEIGTELRFLDNRIGLDFTYYSKVSENQIIPVAVSGASGYTQQVINAGEITNKGVELFLTVVPVRIKNFEWTLTGNFARNRNKLVKLIPGIDNLQLGVAPFNVTVNAIVGEEYGQIMGTDFIYDIDGNKVVDADGRYLESGVTSLGSVLPDYNLGIGSEFKIFGFNVRALVDIQHGGKFFSTTKMWGTYTGILKETGDNGIRENGIVIDGATAAYDANNELIIENGYVKTTGPNTTVLDAHTWATDHYDGPAAQNVLDADYIKLRELTVSYTIPAKLTGPVQNLRVGLYGRNLFTWGTAMKGIDPEQNSSAGNIQGIEGAGLPSLRTFGFNIGFNF